MYPAVTKILGHYYFNCHSQLSFALLYCMKGVEFFIKQSYNDVNFLKC